MWNSGFLLVSLCYTGSSHPSSLRYLSWCLFMMELSRMALGLILLQFALVAPLSKLWGGMVWGGCGVACLFVF